MPPWQWTVSWTPNQNVFQVRKICENFRCNLVLSPTTCPNRTADTAKCSVYACNRAPSIPRTFRTMSPWPCAPRTHRIWSALHVRIGRDAWSNNWHNLFEFGHDTPDCRTIARRSRETGTMHRGPYACDRNPPNRETYRTDRAPDDCRLKTGDDTVLLAFFLNYFASNETRANQIRIEAKIEPSNGTRQRKNGIVLAVTSLYEFHELTVSADDDETLAIAAAAIPPPNLLRTYFAARCALIELNLKKKNDFEIGKSTAIFEICRDWDANNKYNKIIKKKRNWNEN